MRLVGEAVVTGEWGDWWVVVGRLVTGGMLECFFKIKSNLTWKVCFFSNSLASES